MEEPCRAKALIRQLAKPVTVPAKVSRIMATADTTATIARAESTRRRGVHWASLLLGMSDILCLELCLSIGYFLRVALSCWLPVELGASQYRGLALGLLAIPSAFWLSGFYPGHGRNQVERLRKRTHSTAMVFALLLAWDSLVLDRTWSRGILVLTGLFALVIPAICDELLRHYLARKGWWQLPVMILGAGKTGSLIIRLLRSNPSLGLKPTVLFDDDEKKWDTELHGLRVAGPLASANHLRGSISTAIVAIRGSDSARTAEILQTLKLPHVILIPDLEGTQSLWVTARDFGGVIGLDFQRHLASELNGQMKRAMDLILGVPLVALSLPVLAFFAAAIRIADRGPVFYRQMRVGRDGRAFQVLKLRTMRQDSEMMLLRHLAANPDEEVEWRARFKLRRDPRILPIVGRLLRRFSLDELPQLLQVLRGEMSLVGPRPFPSYHMESFPEEFQTFRQTVPPGLTGLWQVSARSDGDLQIQQSLDTYYIRNWSPWLDLHILVHTVRAVLIGKGAY